MRKGALAETSRYWDTRHEWIWGDDLGNFWRHWRLVRLRAAWALVDDDAHV